MQFCIAFVAVVKQSDSSNAFQFPPSPASIQFSKPLKVPYLTADSNNLNIGNITDGNKRNHRLIIAPAEFLDKTFSPKNLQSKSRLLCNSWLCVKKPEFHKRNSHGRIGSRLRSVIFMDIFFARL